MNPLGYDIVLEVNLVHMQLNDSLVSYRCHKCKTFRTSVMNPQRNVLKGNNATYALAKLNYKQLKFSESKVFIFLYLS